jgi:hypothetical protein
MHADYYSVHSLGDAIRAYFAPGIFKKSRFLIIHLQISVHDAPTL